jgi:hypothetical protein
VRVNGTGAPPQDDRDMPVGDDGRRETPTEKLDRNWNEILQELRVTQTGIQILTGFLLTVHFQSRFTDLNEDQRLIYLGLVLMAAVTTGIMVAPVSLHRWLFRRGAKSTLVSTADRLLRVGLVSLAIVVAGVVLLVFDVVTTRTTSTIAAVALFLLLIAGWFVMPAVLGRRTPRQGFSGTPPEDGDGRRT